METESRNKKNKYYIPLKLIPDPTSLLAIRTNMNVYSIHSLYYTQHNGSFSLSPLK